MKIVRSLIDTLYKVPVINKITPLLDAMDAGMFGTDETTSGKPHILDNIDIKRYMILVIFALMPAVLASVIFFGPRVIAIIMVSYIAGAAVEVVFAMVRKHDIHEGFLITGLIFPLVLPPTTPLWVVAVGVIFGTMFGKEMFGGTGRNIFNPALVGRLFITIAFPAIMTMEWKAPLSDTITAATPLTTYKNASVGSAIDPDVVDSDTGKVLFMSASAVKKCAENPKSSFEGVVVNCYNAAAFSEAAKHKILQSPSPALSETEEAEVLKSLTAGEAATYKTLKSYVSDTPKYEILQSLTSSEAEMYKIAQSPPTVSYGRLFVGREPGSMGETCRILVILGGLFLILAKVSNWRTPATYLATVFVAALAGHHFMPGKIAPATFQLLAGGLLFGAFFMATDPVTSPFTNTGKYIAGVSCGILTILIRSFTGYVEGVMFSIVIVNAFTPLIDHIVLMFKYRPAKI